MSENDPTSPDGDPFGPPTVNTEVCCLHCNETYDSYLIEWRVETLSDGREHGFWCCPMSGCDGRGFGFDILPTDPHYRDEHGGWVWDDDEDLEDDNFDEGAEEVDSPKLSDAGVYEPGDFEENDWKDDIPF